MFRVHYGSTIEGETILTLGPEVLLPEASHRARDIGCNVLVYSRFGWYIKRQTAPTPVKNDSSVTYIIK